jgi:hypothetical protein
MSAEMLREAAEVLRARASKATPGPWRSEHHGVKSADGEICRVSSTLGKYEPEAMNRHYIAAMNPDVGRALADWLDTAGADLWAHGPLCACGSGCHDCDDDAWQPHARRALDVARLILGDAS